MLVIGVSSHAELFRHYDVPSEGRVTQEEQREVKPIMSCQIEENFETYTDHIVNSILPRVDDELSVLLRPHISIEGRRVQVAEEVDASDLFHVHVRMPTPQLRFHPLPFDTFLDSGVYHLQYHSFERSSEITEKWREELSQIDDPALSAWLTDVEEHIYLQSQLQDPALGDYSGVNLVIDSPIKEPLSEELIERFSNLWYEHLNSSVRYSEEYKSWLIERLKTRLNFIDPERIIFENHYAHSRSVISLGNEFLILDRLNIPDHAQFANIYFEDRSDMSLEVKALINRVESHGSKMMVRGEEVFTETIEAFKRIESDLNVLKYAHRSPVSSSKHRVISWTDDYVFSVSFSLNCPEPEEEEVKTPPALSPHPGPQ